MLLKSGVDFGAIKADNDVSGNIKHWNACLLRLIHGFLRKLRIALDVFFGILHTDFIKIILSGMAKGTPRCTIDGYL
jgi:hypothetical protein